MPLRAILRRLAAYRQRRREALPSTIDTSIEVPRPPQGRDTWRAAVVGVGGWGRQHVAHLAKLSQVTLVAVADRDSAALDALPEDLAPPAVAHFDDLDRLLAATHQNEPLDLLSIAASSAAHVPLARRAVAAGIGRVVVEKPIGTDLRSVDALLAASDAAGTRLSVNLARRWSADHRAIRDYLARSELGPLRHVTMILGRGGFGMWGIHFLDLMAFYFHDAPVRRVTGRLIDDPTGARKDRSEHDPPGWGVVEFEHGGRGFIDTSPDLTKRDRFIVLRCAHGRIEIDEIDQRWSVVTARGRRLELAFAEPASADTWMRRHLAEAFLDRKPVCDGRTGRAALEMVLALHASDRRGGAPVEVPLEGSDLDLAVQCR